jgi:hypothetical protein
METEIALTDTDSVLVEVEAHGIGFVAMLHDAEREIRARGFGLTREAALEDLKLNLC